jgi:branched-subunit amino acid transport protein
MSALAVLAAGGLASWVLRILFVTLVPAQRLPARFRAAIASAGPAAMAALLMTEFGEVSSVDRSALLPWVGGALVATALAVRFKNLAFTVGGGTIAYGLIAAAL